MSDLLNCCGRLNGYFFRRGRKYEYTGDIFRGNFIRLCGDTECFFFFGDVLGAEGEGVYRGIGDLYQVEGFNISNVVLIKLWILFYQ